LCSQGEWTDRRMDGHGDSYFPLNNLWLWGYKYKESTHHLLANALDITYRLT